VGIFEVTGNCQGRVRRISEFGVLDAVANQTCEVRALGSFGAVIALVGLAIGPFAQQIATYKVRHVESGVGAIIPRALSYEGALVGNTSSSQ
jgi:hypothetical protein